MTLQVQPQNTDPNLSNTGQPALTAITFDDLELRRKY